MHGPQPVPGHRVQVMQQNDSCNAGGEDMKLTRRSGWHGLVACWPPLGSNYRTNKEQHEKQSAVGAVEEVGGRSGREIRTLPSANFVLDAVRVEQAPRNASTHFCLHWLGPFFLLMKALPWQFNLGTFLWTLVEDAEENRLC